jgi:hypothetical protein
MTFYRKFNYCLIFTLIFIVSFGFALALLWTAHSQGFAANSEIGGNASALNGDWLYVSKDGNGTSGLTWTEAFTNVQDALAEAEAPAQIWVAEGIYYPDEGGGQNNNDSYATFVMTNGVALYGGFKHGDASITDRDWEKNLTILSGDIDKNDISPDGVIRSTDHIIGTNTRHVVTAKGVDRRAVIDGFTITAGQAYMLGGISGGGFLCVGSGKGNLCSPALKNITFSGNLAEEFGGGMYNNGFNGGESSPKLINVAFKGNTSLDEGGAIHNDGRNTGSSSPELINVLFSGNTARKGGAMYNDGEKSKPILTNITFSGNRAEVWGGAMYNKDIDNMIVSNSVFWDNLDSSGPGTISSTIVNYEATITLVCSLVQGAGASGSGNWIQEGSYIDGGCNIDQDPKFTTPVDPNAAPTSAGNLRLKKSSPAVDTGNNNAVSISTDLDGANRIVDGDADGTLTVDMGAYEFPVYQNYLALIFH